MRTVSLGDVAQIVSGATPKTSVLEYWGGDVQWATPADLSGLRSPYISGTPRTLTEAGAKSCATTVLPAGSILLSSRAPIGHVAINTVPMATNQGFKSLVLSSELDAKFIYYWLKSKTELLQSLGNGATFKELSKKTTEQIKIPLPPLPEQRRIAAILDKADAIRAKRRQMLAHLETLSESIFHSMQWGDVAASRTLSLADSYWFQEGPGIRKWQFTSEGVKLLNVANILKNGTLDLARTERYVGDEEARGRYSHFIADPGDLVIASSGISFQADGLLSTRAAFVSDQDLPLLMNTSTIRFKAREGLSTLRFLQGWFQSSEFRTQITRLVTGSAQQNFGPSHLKQLSITLPEYSDQLEHQRQVARIHALALPIERALAADDELFASLQSRAFKGEL